MILTPARGDFMPEMTVPPAYAVVTTPERTMFGKRTGAIVATLTGEYGSEVARAAGPTATDAKTALMRQLAQLCDEPRPTYLFCGDGTVLVVFRTFTGWEYEMVSAERTYPCGCLMNVTTRAQAVAAAASHADQSYGGVVRQLR